MTRELITWLHEKTVENILKTSEKDSTIKVINFKVKLATDDGDNSCSEVYRVFIEYSNSHGNLRILKKKSIILKVAIAEDGPFKEYESKIGLFRTESSMILETLNKMNEVLGYANPLCGRGFCSQNVEPVWIAMEDLCPLGYQMADRLRGLDLDHGVLAVQGLARFHASSVAIIEKDPTIKNWYPNGMFTEEYERELPFLASFCMYNVRTLAEEISRWPEVDEKCADKVSRISEIIFKLGIESTRCLEDDFNVINHGDFWINNMMFRYDELGKPTSHIMMDFQYSKYTSPAVDLLYFLSSSLTDEVYTNQSKKLIREYHKTLVDTMQRIGCKTTPVSFEKLHQNLEDRAVYGMVMTFIFLPMSFVGESEVLSIDDLMTSEEFRPSPGLHNPRCRQILVQRLAEYDKMGLLDV